MFVNHLAVLEFRVFRASTSQLFCSDWLRIILQTILVLYTHLRKCFCTTCTNFYFTRFRTFCTNLFLKLASIDYVLRICLRLQLHTCSCTLMLSCSSAKSVASKEPELFPNKTAILFLICVVFASNLTFIPFLFSFYLKTIN